MDEKYIATMFVIVMMSAIFFLGVSITGYFVQTVEYEELCSSDADCASGQCCIIYEEGLGLCMENCQSVEFLCRNNGECEPGTVCCISGGMKYGICNQAEKCKSIDLFAQYVEKRPVLEKPAPQSLNYAVVFETILIIILLGVIFWLLKKKKK